MPGQVTTDKYKIRLPTPLMLTVINSDYVGPSAILGQIAN